MGLSLEWFCHRLFPPESSLGIYRMYDRDTDRSSPWNRPFLRDRHSASPHYGAAPYIRHYHDGCDLLWSDVRSVDDGNSGQIPGEASSVPTAMDGYEMAEQGRAGPALGIAAISSFVAGTLGIVGLTFFAPALANFALALVLRNISPSCLWD